MQASGRKALQSRDRHASHCRHGDREQARCCSFILSLNDICARGASLSLHLRRGRRHASGLTRRLYSTSLFPFISTGVVGKRGASHARPRQATTRRSTTGGVTNPLGMFQFACATSWQGVAERQSRVGIECQQVARLPHSAPTRQNECLMIRLVTCSSVQQRCIFDC